MLLKQNGGFVVRRRCDDDVDGYPYALSVVCNSRMHNIRIRRRHDNTFALGNEKPNENVRPKWRSYVNEYIQTEIANSDKLYIIEHQMMAVAVYKNHITLCDI